MVFTVGLSVVLPLCLPLIITGGKSQAVLTLKKVNKSSVLLMFNIKKKTNFQLGLGKVC